jgi:hypothetical protein
MVRFMMVFLLEQRRWRSGGTFYTANSLEVLEGDAGTVPEELIDALRDSRLRPYRASVEKNRYFSIAAHLNCRILCAAN